MAMAYAAGAELADMEFVQFHPTALNVADAPRFLLSEAMRGEGGVLRNEDGRRFMPRYHERAELAPRDIVSRSIVAEMERTATRTVYLDMTALAARYLRRRFPKIYDTCLRYGLDITREPVPVSPAAHYIMGGVRTDLDGRTTLPGLYAAGEVACTGVHGANRLASNSLLEGLVFGARAGRAIVADAARQPRATGGMTLSTAAAAASVTDDEETTASGEIVLAGFYAEPLSFAFPPAFMREARIRVAAEWKQPDLAAVTALIAAGRLSLDGLITHRHDATQAPAAYRTAFGDPACLKMVLDWRACS